MILTIEPSFYLGFFGDSLSQCRSGSPGSCYVDQVDLNVQRSSSLCLPSAKIKGMQHCAQLLWIFFCVRRNSKQKFAILAIFVVLLWYKIPLWSKRLPLNSCSFSSVPPLLDYRLSPKFKKNMFVCGHLHRPERASASWS